MKAPLLALLIPCVVLAACNRADTPRNGADTSTTPTPTSVPGTDGASTTGTGTNDTIPNGPNGAGPAGAADLPDAGRGTVPAEDGTIRDDRDPGTPLPPR